MGIFLSNFNNLQLLIYYISFDDWVDVSFFFWDFCYDEVLLSIFKQIINVCLTQTALAVSFFYKVNILVCIMWMILNQHLSLVKQIIIDKSIRLLHRCLLENSRIILIMRVYVFYILNSKMHDICIKFKYFEKLKNINYHIQLISVKNNFKTIELRWWRTFLKIGDMVYIDRL